MKKLLLFAIVILGFSAASYAQSSATASTTATLIIPISIANDEDMNFGTIGASATAGTVALDYSDVPIATGGATVITGGTPKTAVFIVTGEGTSAISVSVPTGNITLTDPVSSATMEVGSFVADCGASTTLETGSKTIKVKATLTVPVDAVAGVYANADGLKVTVNYE